MIPIVTWFLVGEAGGLASLVLGWPALAGWFIAAGAWAAVQYDDGWRRRGA